MEIVKLTALSVTMVIMAFSANNANADITLREKTEHYVIDEPVPQKLLHTASKTIKKECGNPKRRDLICSQYNTAITYDTVKLGMGKCTLSNVQIIDNVIYKKPKWKQKLQHSDITITKWDELIKKSMLHAKSHWKLRKKHLKLAHIRLSKLEARCGKIKRNADEIIDKANSKIKRDNKRLDSKEDHFPSSFPNNDAPKTSKKGAINKH